MFVPDRPCESWSLDFAGGVVGAAPPLRILTVIDDFLRECLVLACNNPRSGRRVARELDGLIWLYGKPAIILWTMAPN